MSINITKLPGKTPKKCCFAKAREAATQYKGVTTSKTGKPQKITVAPWFDNVNTNEVARAFRQNKGTLDLNG